VPTPYPRPGGLAETYLGVGRVPWEGIVNVTRISVPSIHSSALKNLGVSDTARLDEFFDHTGTVIGLIATQLEQTTVVGWHITHLRILKGA